MHPTFISRLSKMLLITAATVSVGAGIATHAAAQKGNGIDGDSAVSTGFFSFNLGNRGVLLASLSASLEAGAIDQLKFKDATALQAFYAARNGQTLWIDSRGADHRPAAAVLEILEKSWTHGLNPDSYHVKEIQALLNARQPSEKAQLELLVTDAVVRYARDLSGFRLPAAAIRQEASFWRQPMAAADILRILSAQTSPVAAVQNFSPKDAFYQRLQAELVTLSTDPDRAYEEYLPVSFGGRLFRPGEFNKNVLKLRARLGLKHDPAYGPENKYDDDLAAAVMNFQRENGLYPDGVIGTQTLAVLNRTVRDRMEQIVANLERLRWVDHDRPGRYILVNIPSATLWAVENDAVAFEMPVIVGRPERQTRSFITEITGVRFNPKWTVPPTIKARDFLPKLMEDPTYLVNKGIDLYQVVDGKRETLDSTAIDWTTVQTSDLRHLRMVQAAGDNNALGRIRVLMDNPYDIYLHDTNAPEYFKKPDRAASSGCIRLSEPEKVARFILGNNQDWSEQRMTRILETGRTSEINAEQRIPVYILYQTMWTDAEGHLVYGPDIYKQDKRMIEAMASLDVYHLPDLDDLQLASTGTDASLR